MWIADPESYRQEHLQLARDIIRKCNPSDSGCYEWRGAITNKGYGRMKYKGRARLTHRLIAYAAGIIDSLESKGTNHVLHKCDNPRCCRPAHLFKGTQKDNVLDAMQKGRHRVFRG